MRISTESIFFLKKIKWIYILPFFILSSCYTSQELSPQERRSQKREDTIEKYILAKTKSSERYESLGFGPLKVYKPDVFYKLDSLYEIKYEYEEKGQLARFEKLGLQDEIEKAKAEAKKEKDEVTFEVEHIYSKSKGVNLTIHHDYFVLNDQDSILIHTPFYSYEIPLSYKDMQLKYLFELNFLSDYGSYISERELSFIKYFKEREQQLIGEQNKLNDFMVHTLSLMMIAKGARSVDFVELAKSIASTYLSRRYHDVVITNFGSLIADEDDNGKVEKYTFSLKWRGEVDGERINMETEIEFSPYLEPREVIDKKIEE